MAEDIKSIAQRLKGLREILDIPLEQMAETCETSVEDYLKLESGEGSPSIPHLSRISKRYGIALDVLLFGEEPRMQGYFVTRRGQGPTVERRKEYFYQSLASGFNGRRMEPFLTRIDPLPEGQKHKPNSHEGQEFNYILDGILEFTLGDKVMVLEPGDSIYFDSSCPHSMRALGNATASFLAIII